MRLQSLIHLVDSIRALCQPRRVIVLGSGALLANFPEIGEDDGPLEKTLDGDFLLEPTNEQIAEVLKDAIGAESVFFDTNGYYADCMRPGIVRTFPAGWESRLVPLAGYDDVFALDPYDVALIKLVVGRKKDLDLVRALVGLGKLEVARIEIRYRETPLCEAVCSRRGGICWRCAPAENASRRGAEAQRKNQEISASLRLCVRKQKRPRLLAGVS